MARFTRLREGHRQQTAIKIHMLPASIEDFALAGPGGQQQAHHLSHLDIAITVELCEEALDFGRAQIALARPVVIEWIDAHAGVPGRWQNFPADRTVIDEFQ